MQNVKGTYDFFGREQAIRKWVQTVLKEVFTLYDFDEMESTIVSELDLLTSKYAGGDEIIKEMYQLTDQGMRKLGLRYDLTVPFAKVIALNPGIEFPYRRYEIGKVFRDGPVKRGRLREFLQCDVDVVGIEGPEAEAELMQVAVEVFKRLDVPIVLRWNNRQFLGEILEAIGVPSDEKLSAMLTLDKLEKIGNEGVVKELISKGFAPQVVSAITELIGMADPSFELLSSTYGLEQTKGSSEVRTLQQLIDKISLASICKFDPFLSRGLSFYTGTVYEIFDAEGGFSSSLGGGGRYDAIIGKLVGREDMAYPTVGLSFGMESIMEMMKDRPIQLPLPRAVIIPIGDTVHEVLGIASVFRSNGVRIRLELGKRKLKKSLAALATSGIRYVILIGNDEASIGKIRLKDMEKMTEDIVTVQEAMNRVAQE